MSWDFTRKPHTLCKQNVNNNFFQNLSIKIYTENTYNRINLLSPQLFSHCLWCDKHITIYNVYAYRMACAAYLNRNECEPKPKYTHIKAWALRKEVVVKRKCHCNYNYNYYVCHDTTTTGAATVAATTYLHAGSPTSLKKTQVPPFKQNAFPITGHVEPECVQFICWFECPARNGNKKWNWFLIEARQVAKDSLSFSWYNVLLGKLGGQFTLVSEGSTLQMKLNHKLHLLVYSRAFGNTSILVNFLIGCRVNLFFALHSYCPESLARADLIISSERRLWWKEDECKNKQKQISIGTKRRINGFIVKSMKWPFVMLK